jgi:hypothetical protein
MNPHYPSGPALDHGEPHRVTPGDSDPIAFVLPTAHGRVAQRVIVNLMG